ncbi:MAG TPA: DUF72 domain-containing protein [Fulvivirga sp.]|nr:DUF72 domain-containing protein [Fulvivirga sp.]
MKFGDINPAELDQHQFILPVDHPDTSKVLSEGKGNVKIYVGCAKWGRKEWVGDLYPAGTKDKDFLSEYVKHFNAIEMNSTFYSVKKANVQAWAEKAPDDFKFSPKFNRSISHIKRLNEDAYRYTDYFLDAISGFEHKLGASFLQVPDNFTSKYLDRLVAYIKQLPKELNLSVEFRHESWFEDPTICDETFQMLKEHNMGAVITDVATRRDVLHSRLTIPKAFIRFNGYGLHKTDYERLDNWVDLIQSWVGQGLEEVYFYAHQEDESFTPRTCDYLIEKLNKSGGYNIRKPQFQG